MKKLFLSLLLFIFFESVLAQTKDLAYYEKELTTYMKKKDPYGAMEFLTQGIEEAPDSAFLYYMRGVLLDAFQNYDAAIQDFDLGYKKAQSDKEKSSFLTSLGGLKAKVRKFEEAEKYLLLALEYDSLNLATLNNLSTILDDLEKMDESILILEKIIRIDPEFIPAYVNLGFKYGKKEEHDKALKYFDKAIAIDPDEPLSYSNRSYSRLKTGDIKGAMKDINLSLKLYPMNSYAYKLRALIYIEQGKTELACSDLATAMDYGYAEQYGEDILELINNHCDE